MSESGFQLCYVILCFHVHTIIMHFVSVICIITRCSYYCYDHIPIVLYYQRLNLMPNGSTTYTTCVRDNHIWVIQKLSLNDKGHVFDIIFITLCRVFVFFGLVQSNKGPEFVFIMFPGFKSSFETLLEY